MAVGWNKCVRSVYIFVQTVSAPHARPARPLGLLTALAFAAACGGGAAGPSTPTSATTTPTVTALAVAGCLATDNFQCRATATLSNGSTQDVTAQAQWSSSNTAVATISSGGVVTLVASGQVQIRAAYQTVSAVRDIVATVTPPARFFALSGLVTAESGQPISGATVRVTDAAGTTHARTTDGGGFYHAAPLREGVVTVVAAATGYQSLTRSADLTQDLRLPDLRLVSIFTPPPPPPTQNPSSCTGVPSRVDCGIPTARCNNGDWSCSQSRSGTCSRNDGVACWVCPGPLC